jgi:predicted MPP superfamily phosphohydrolase
MKTMRFAIFFSIFFTIHFLINFYIYRRGLQGLEAAPQLAPYFKVIMLFLVLAYPVGRFLEKIWYSPFSSFIHWAGAFWFAGMLYFTLTIITLDIIRLIISLINFYSIPSNTNYPFIKLVVTYTSTILIVLLIIIGHINAWTPKTVQKTIHIPKNGGEFDSLKIAIASDIHLGTIIGPRKTGKLIKTINALNADLVLLAGDVVDEDVKPVIKQNLGKNLQLLNAPLGNYAITGNHEYIGGIDDAVNYLEEHGLKIIRDSSILINNSVYIIGREDKDKYTFTRQKRKTIHELTQSINKEKPIILLDHQPFNLDSAVKTGIDLQLSGHTHHGQLWPFNYITNKVFELSRGYKQKENTHILVSSGFGTWGPPVRIGNRPEIIELTLTFKNNKAPSIK